MIQNHEKCNELNVEMPILNEIYDILYNDKKPSEALVALMTRDLKRER